MQEKNIIVKYAIILAIYAGIAGGVLAITFAVTEPRRLENAKKNQLLAQQEVLPQALKFIEVTTQNLTYAKAVNEDNKLVGYVFLAEGKGYSSTIQLMVGVDQKLSLIGLKVLAQTETPGLGTRITEDSFLKQFFGKTKPADFGLKKEGGEIDAITGATISSRAVARTLSKTIENLNMIIKEEKK